MGASTPTSLITNCWAQPRTRERLELTETVVYRAVDGAAYNHHPQVCYHQGLLYATWSNGYRDEDVPGQRMLVSTSADLGRSWTPARPLVDRMPGRHVHGVVTNGGLLSHADGLTAYFNYYDRTYTGMLMYYAWKGNASLGDLPERQFDPETSYTGMLTSTDGVAWHGPIRRIDGAFPNWAPVPLADGRLLMAGNAGVAWTDDPTGVDGWQRSTLPRIPPEETDDPEGFILACRARGDRHNHCESSFIQTDDGVIHRLMRTGQGWLSVSESRDRGETWSEPVPSSYTDVSSKHVFGRLPDGRFYGLSTPQPSSPRTPLVLAVSEDGIRFDRHWVVGDAPNELARLPGMHKYGRYGYPHLCIAEDQVCILYSMNKEDILFVRFPLKTLA